MNKFKTLVSAVVVSFSVAASLGCTSQASTVPQPHEGTLTQIEGSQSTNPTGNYGAAVLGASFAR